MQHIKDIWPSVKDLADDLRVPYTTAHSWIIRARIPAVYDLELIKAAKKRGKKLTLEVLASARRSSVYGDTHIASSVDASPAIQPRRPRSGKSAAEVSR